MSNSGKSWLKTLVKLLILIAFIIGGVFICERIFKKSDKERLAIPTLDPINFGKVYASEDQLLVVNYLVPKSPESQQLSAILGKIDSEKTYGDRVICRELEVNFHRTFAKENGVDLYNFTEQLDFFVGGEKRGSLKGVTDPKIVHETIQTYLDGMIKRYGKGWVPEVPGMKRADQATGETGIRPKF